VNVGVIGAGQVAQALGRGLVSRGHQAKLSSRTPEKLDDWVAEAGEAASAGSFAEAAQFGELLILATAWTGTQQAIEQAGAENFAGKVLIDVTNPLDFSEGAPKLSIGHTDSAGEQVQRWLPDAKVVKAFNIVGNQFFVDPDLPGGPPDMFIAGDDADAKREVGELIESFGWPSAIDLGGLETSRYLEPLAMVWILYGFGAGSFDHAFKLLRR
jgi:predicted dinucleotide-binding enzyme